MSKFRVYIKPFNESGEYQSDFIDITRDVLFSSMGDIRRKIDNDEYNVGLFKFDSINLSVRNEHGRFSDANLLGSIFKFKRSDSIVKITWEVEDDGPYCGVAVAGDCFLSEEIEVFMGLLNDQSAQTDIRQQNLNFSVMGLESVFDRAIVPFADISNGDLISAVILDCLNQPVITNLLTVDAGNIALGLDQTIDDITSLENKTVKQALDDLLFLSNSVLYIDGQSVFIKSRSPSATVLNTYYGQASDLGIENIESIGAIRTGINRTFNFWTWAETSLFAEDESSINRNGVRKKEISSDLITNSTKRQNILNSLRTEFAFPKMEMELRTYLDYDFFDLGFFSKINIDYPAISFPSAGSMLPVYGSAIYGEAVYPETLFSLVLTSLDEFKITGFVVSIKNQSYALTLRGV